MSDGISGSGSLGEVTVFLDYFKDLPDPRQAGKVVYPLNEVLLPSLLAVLANAESFTDIARFGEKKLALLRRFLPFADGTPPMTDLAISSPRWMQQPSSAALSIGSQA